MCFARKEGAFDSKRSHLKKKSEERNPVVLQEDDEKKNQDEN